LSSDPTRGWQAPSAKRLLVSVVAAVVVAVLLLVTVILPAEYGIDPTGVGNALGLTALRAPARTMEITDVLAGNEAVREVEIPDVGEPVPLPNPAVHQSQGTGPETRTLMITIPQDGQTEIKTVLQQSKVVTYSWQVDRGTVYCDFHGHDPAAGNEFFVRYEEHQEGATAGGSLVAPFAGEHGWYWLNYNEFPVTITLTVTGYFDDIKDYGIF
jgi:hypothetical protein